MKRVETKGSIWVFDEDVLVYFRFPKTEAPRECPEWGNAEAGKLQDAVPHSYVEWKIDKDRYSFMDVLLIDTGEGWGSAVYAPYAVLP